MPRRRNKVDPLEELETCTKLLCDQSHNHMKVREYDKALIGYNKVVNVKSGEVKITLS